ncbi:copper amine oxidase N-terminal domain-containing protein [Fontibacillus sp. BL9]|uniref:copper amine oxidase N-terminal domain-containing protein n=1 Tax=Fontibacillus sp. BL9 TaxID=3389971 RepID=UPI00397BD829
MKKMLGLLLCLIVCVASFQSGPVARAASPDRVIGSPKLAVLVDGRKVKFQGGDPVSENGRVQVPLRGIGEALGAEVDFSGNTVTYTKEAKSIVLTLGSKVAVVDGNSVTMDAAAKAVKGRTYVPLRFVSENLGEPVSWDQVGNWVWIGSKEVPTLEEAGIKPQEIESFKDLIDPVAGLYEGRKDAYVFSYDQLPLKICDRILYDIWEVKQAGNDGIRIRYSSGKTAIYYLSENITGARVRYDVEGMRIKNADGSITLTYHVDSRRDGDLIKDKNYENFTIDEAIYLGFVISFESLFFLKDPLK